MNSDRRNVTHLAVRFTGVAFVLTLVGADARPQPRAPLEGGAKAAHETPAAATVITEVSDSKALAYVNNRKFVIDAQGRAYCAVRTRGPHGTGVCLLRSAGRWPNVDRFDPAWLEDRPGLEISTAPQRHPSLDVSADGNVHLVWYGGTAIQPAHQIRYARFTTTGLFQLAEEMQPFTVAGFESVYTGVLTGEELWQEHPCVATGPDGTYLAWEARDRSRLNPVGAPQPGIAWAVRGADGLWSVSGTIDRPPYAEVDARFPSQSRPTLVLAPNGDMHVLCYGSVGGVQQILHGVLKSRVFSGWSVVCPSSGDQRQVSAAMDPTGRVHIAWREGAVMSSSGDAAGRGRSAPKGDAVVAAGAGTGVAVFYAALDPGGRVTGPMRVSPTAESASTPSITVSGGRVWVAWVAWNPGDLNSEGKRDNGYPSDNATVEGRLEVRSAKSGAPSFGPVLPLDAGPVCYPTWASRGDAAGPPDALMWTRAEAGSYQLVLGRITPP